MIAADRLADVFVEMADTLVDDYDVVEFLHLLTQHAADVSGAAAVGLLLTDHHDRLQFIASSDQSVDALELFQLQISQGPCWDCFHEQAPVLNAQLADSATRWPMFAPEALRAGFQSVNAFPLHLRDRYIGAMGLFGTTEIRFDEQDARVVQAMADVATIAILQERTIHRAEGLVEQLQLALTSRVVIEQAKGALAQRDGISLDEAFERLRREARSSRMLLTDVARDTLRALQPPAW